MTKRLKGSGFYETPNVDYKPTKPKPQDKKKPPKPVIHKGSKYGNARNKT